MAAAFVASRYEPMVSLGLPLLLLSSAVPPLALALPLLRLPSGLPSTFDQCPNLCPLMWSFVWSSVWSLVWCLCVPVCTRSSRSAVRAVRDLPPSASVTPDGNDSTYDAKQLASAKEDLIELQDSISDVFSYYDKPCYSGVLESSGDSLTPALVSLYREVDPDRKGGVEEARLDQAQMGQIPQLMNGGKQKLSLGMIRSIKALRSQIQLGMAETVRSVKLLLTKHEAATKKRKDRMRELFQTLQSSLEKIVNPPPKGGGGSPQTGAGVLADGSPVKRGRGRPRKNPISLAIASAAAEAVAEQAGSVADAKRGDAPIQVTAYKCMASSSANGKASVSAVLIHLHGLDGVGSGNPPTIEFQSADDGAPTTTLNVVTSKRGPCFVASVVNPAQLKFFEFVLMATVSWTTTSNYEKCVPVKSKELPHYLMDAVKLRNDSKESKESKQQLNQFLRGENKRPRPVQQPVHDDADDAVDDADDAADDVGTQLYDEAGSDDETDDEKPTKRRKTGGGGGGAAAAVASAAKVVAKSSAPTKAAAPVVSAVAPAVAAAAASAPRKAVTFATPLAAPVAASAAPAKAVASAAPAAASAVIVPSSQGSSLSSQASQVSVVGSQSSQVDGDGDVVMAAPFVPPPRPAAASAAVAVAAPARTTRARAAGGK
jgi:hypothetical protein